MYITGITYKRTRNLGNYNNESLEAVASIGFGDDVEDSIAKLKTIVILGLLKETEEPDYPVKKVPFD